MIDLFDGEPLKCTFIERYFLFFSYRITDKFYFSNTSVVGINFKCGIYKYLLNQRENFMPQQ